jgi:hypothetical protein
MAPIVMRRPRTFDAYCSTSLRYCEQEVDDQQHPADEARSDAPPAFRRNGLVDRFLDRPLELL